MKINEETIFQVLDSIYDNVLIGLPGSETVFELSEAYLNEHVELKAAADALIRWQTAKCAASGFLSGIGGALAMPLALPAHLAATYYVQMRMVAAIAHMHGHDVRSDQVRSFVYSCLLGDEVGDALKEVGLRLGKQLSRKAIEGMTKDFTRKLHTVVGNRLFNKCGSQNMVKLIPIAGGVLGAIVNGYCCKEVGKTALRVFPAQDSWPFALAS